MPRSSSSKRNHSQQPQLRLIGGQWRGRKLTIADVPGLRPTGDRIRETLFNWLMMDMVDSHCLDLFAGSGALGLECLSRGAAHVTLIEKHPIANKQLHDNLQLLIAAALEQQRVALLQQDAMQWLNQPTVEPGSIDIVFIDPPFAAELWERVCQQLEESQLLAPQALVYIESPKSQPLTLPNNWQVHRQKYAGDVSYALYQRDV